MKVGGRFDLAYCSNIHAGERWTEVEQALTTSLPRVRSLLGHEGPLAIGLRLSADAARDLEDPERLEPFRDFLRDGSYYVPTINGFPYGAFHGTRVKEQVYAPDWRTHERLDYTNRLARLLAVLSAGAEDLIPSISTVPGAFRAEVKTNADREAIADRILEHAAYLKRLRQESGRRIALAIEPEPACFLETVDDVVVFFERYLFDRDRSAAAARRGGVELTAGDVADHIGVCLDACHMAVEFEDPAAAFARLASAGIGIYKVQLSSALRVAGSATDSPAALLAPFADDTYLHQVVASNRGELTRYTDLPEAMTASGGAALCAECEWRVHFHVPIFLKAMSSGFESTQTYLAEVLAVLDRTSACRQLEVETYTWDVLPPEYRTTDVCRAIARELDWVRTVIDRF